MQDLVVGEFDLPWLSLGQLVAGQKASLEIFEDRLRRNVERRRGALDRVGFVRPARRVGLGPVDLDGRKPPSLAQKPDVFALEEATAGVAKPSRFNVAAISLSILPDRLRSLTRRRRVSRSS